MVGINYDKDKRHTCKIERISDKFPINEDVSDKISDKLRKIIAQMQANNGGITQVEVAKMFMVSDRQARNYLTMLADQGHIVRLGANKDRTYKLK